MQDEKIHLDVRFPAGMPDTCEVLFAGKWERFALADCDRIFGVPGLYEEIFHRHVDFQSHARVMSLLDNTLRQFGERPHDLRVLELGAGNGIVGERMRELGVPALAGLDASSSARDAAHRDRPQVYDRYFVTVGGSLSPGQRQEIEKFAPNCLLAVAGLGCREARTAMFEGIASQLGAGTWLLIYAGHEWSDGGRSYATVLKEMAARGEAEINSYAIFSQDDGRPYAVMVARKRGKPASEPLALHRDVVLA